MGDILTVLLASLPALVVALIALQKATSTRRETSEALREQKQSLRAIETALKGAQHKGAAATESAISGGTIPADRKQRMTLLWRRHKPFIVMRKCITRRLLSLNPNERYSNVLGECLKPFLQAINDLPSEMIAATKKEFEAILEPGREFDGSGSRARAILESARERIESHIADMEEQIKQLSGLSE